MTLIHATASSVPAALVGVPSPPVFVPELLRGLLSGARWDATRDAALNVAQEAVLDGVVGATRNERRLLGAGEKKPKPGKTKKDAKTKALIPLQNALTKKTVLQGKQLAEKLQSIRFDVLDATFGDGTHTEALLEAGEPFTRVVGLDCDWGAQAAADSVTATYGSSRFKFFPGKLMSETLALFGHNAFDAIIVDPGASMGQLTNPRRGFEISPVDDADNHDGSLDMRYSSRTRSTVLEVLNSMPKQELVQRLNALGGMATADSLDDRRNNQRVNVKQSEIILNVPEVKRLVNQICARRPFRGLHDILNAVDQSHIKEKIPSGGWLSDSWSEVAWSRLPPALRIFAGLRAIVNDEVAELEKMLDAARWLLRDGGRCAVVARFPWERRLVKQHVAESATAVLLSETKILPSDALEYSQPLGTSLFVFERCSPEKLAAIRAATVTEEMLQRDAQRYVMGLDAAQEAAGYGFPAPAFTKEDTLSDREVAAVREGLAPVSADRAAPISLRERRNFKRRPGVE